MRKESEMYNLKALMASFTCKISYSLKNLYLESGINSSITHTDLPSSARLEAAAAQGVAAALYLAPTNLHWLAAHLLLHQPPLPHSAMPESVAAAAMM
jgi:hypothetical protein